MAEVRPIITLALLAAAGWLVYLLTPVLTPFLISALLAYLFHPPVTWLARRGLPRAAGAALMFTLIGLTIAGLLIFLVPALLRQIGTFLTKAPAYLDWLQHTALPQAQALLGIELALDLPAIRQAVIDHWREVGSGLGIFFSYVTKSGLSLLAWLVNLLLIPLVTFYLLLDGERMLDRAFHLLRPATQSPMRRLGRETDEVLGGFLRGQMLVMIALAVIYSVGLSFVGLDLALPIGLFSGLVSFVPYLGFITGVLSASLAAYLQFHDASQLLWVLGVFMTGQLLESFVLTPRWVGQRIGLHPVAVIFAVMAGGQLFGFFGVLLALPAAAVLKVWAGHVHERYLRDAAGKKRRAPSRPP